MPHDTTGLTTLFTDTMTMAAEQAAANDPRAVRARERAAFVPVEDLLYAFAAETGVVVNGLRTPTLKQLIEDGRRWGNEYIQVGIPFSSGHVLSVGMWGGRLRGHHSGPGSNTMQIEWFEQTPEGHQAAAQWFVERLPAFVVRWNPPAAQKAAAAPARGGLGD